MDIVRCENGHFYDASENPTCPQCAADAANGTVGIEQIPATSPVMAAIDDSGPLIEAIPPTVPVGRNSETVPVNNPGFTPNDFMPGDVYQAGTPLDPIPATKPHYENNVYGFRPITGWLVCVEGPNKGTDYRVVSGNNNIGRSESSNICILNDAEVSYSDHATITYDPKSRKFYFGLKSGSNPVYVNGNIVFSPVEVKAFDEILVGSTKLIFVPFCGEKFDWSE